MPRVVCRRGLTLLEILLILLGLTVLATMATQCYIALRPPAWYTVPVPPNRQTPAITIAPGNTLLGPGHSMTYTATITYPNPVSATDGWWVFASIYEHDTVHGDVLLQRRVGFLFPAGANTANGTFTLTCVDTNGVLTIRGADGSDVYESVWNVYAYVDEQQASDDGRSAAFEFKCASD
jgi:hypothetical protein